MAQQDNVNTEKIAKINDKESIKRVRYRTTDSEYYFVRTPKGRVHGIHLTKKKKFKQL